MAKQGRLRQMFEMTAVSSRSAIWLLQNLAFILFLGVIAIVYIANAHYTYRTVRDIKVLQEEIKEKRSMLNALNAELMQKSKKAEIALAVEHLGIKPSNEGPKKIIVKKN